MLTTLRYLRADAHAVAGHAAGHTAESVAVLDPMSAERIAIEADTDSRKGAALRKSPPDALDELIRGVAGLAAQRKP